MPLNGKMHGGHRERLKDRFLRDGLENFEEHNILELMLFYVIPQRDTNELAHSLLTRFGSLEGVLNADVEALREADGIGEHAALFLNLFSGLMDAYIDDRKQNETITGTKNIIDFAVRKLAFSEMECLIVCFIDNKQTLLNWHYVQEGYIGADTLDTKSLVRMFIGTNTTRAILVRNYLKGKAKFGQTDLKIVKESAVALKRVGVKLADYIVVGSDRKYAALTSTPEVEHYKMFLG